MRNCVVFLLMSIFTGAAFGEARYVTDVLYVPIRSGASSGHKVLATMKTGEKLVLLDDDVDNGFVEVKNTRGLTGYIPARYLVDQPVAATQLKKLKAQVAKAKNGMSTQSTTMKGLKDSLRKKSSQEVALKKEAARLERELNKIMSISGDAIAVAAERDQLKERVRSLEEDNGGLMAKNQLLVADNQNEGIKLGIGAVLLCIVLGFVSPYLKPRRRSSSHMMRLR